VQRKVRIWTKIFFIVLVAVMPTVILTLYSAISFRAVYINEQKSVLSNLCDGFVNEQRLIARNAEEMLLAVSQTPLIKDGDHGSLDRYFKDLMSVYPDYAVLLVADSDGMVIGSGVEKTGYSIADRDYFRKALKTGLFTIGTYLVSRSTGIDSVPFALAVRNRMGKTVVLICSYSLHKYSHEFSVNRLKGNSILEVFDQEGHRLYSTSTDPHDGLGKPVMKPLFEQAQKNTGTKASRVTLAGSDWLLSCGTFLRNGNCLYVTVRTPFGDVQKASALLLFRIISLMLLACSAALALSLWLARRLIVRRIEGLTSYTRSLAEGNLEVRSEINNTHDEITDLTESFNKMAEALEERNRSNLQTIEEKEILLRELQKRVADNLQLLSSIVSLQICHAPDDAVRHSLTTTHSRIMALSLVYETLYLYSDVQKVQMRQYCNGLCEFLVSLYANVGSEIACTVSGLDVSVSLDKALALALILNELVSNSLVHAFPGGQNGSISISFEAVSKDTVLMRLSDTGIGFQGNTQTNIHGNETLGYEMIEALVEQIHGNLQISSGPCGTQISIRFPAEAAAS
jgi:Signal transduction histidine kinase